MKKQIALLILVSSLCGCETWKRAYVAIHDGVDAVLADSTNAVPVVIPALTNIIPPVVTSDPAAQEQWPCVEVDWMTHGWEGEDELRMAAVNKARSRGLNAIGFKLKYTDNKHLVIALWEWEHDEEAGKFRLDNFTRRARDKGIKRWVVDIGSVDPNWVNDIFRAYGPSTDFQVQYIGVRLTSEVMSALECDQNGVKQSAPRRRKDAQAAKSSVKFQAVPVVWSKPDVPPVVEPPPSSMQDITVPPRLGVDLYEGNGVNGTYRELPGGKNPDSYVSLSAWVNIRSWPRRDVGCHIINKGSVGNSWAYGLTVKPDEVSYTTTRGVIAATVGVSPNVWHHVRCDATQDGVQFWLDGKAIAVTRREVTALFNENAHPLRIGGHSMAWTPPSAWFNGSLDGSMSDYSIIVR